MGGILETEIMQKCKVNYSTARLIGNQARENLAVSRWVSYSEELVEEGLRIHLQSETCDHFSQSAIDDHIEPSGAAIHLTSYSRAETLLEDELKRTEISFASSAHNPDRDRSNAEASVLNTCIPDIAPSLSHQLRKCEAFLSSTKDAAIAASNQKKRRPFTSLPPLLLMPPDDEQSTDTGGLGDFWLVPHQEMQNEVGRIHKPHLTSQRTAIHAIKPPCNSRSTVAKDMSPTTIANAKARRNSEDHSILSSLSSHSGTFIFCDNTVDSPREEIRLNKNSKKSKTTPRGATPSLAAYFRRLNKSQHKDSSSKLNELRAEQVSSSDKNEVDSVTSNETDSDIDSGCSNLMSDIMTAVGQCDRSVQAKEFDDDEISKEPGTLRLEHAKDTIDASCGVLDTVAPKCPRRLASLVHRTIIIPIKIRKLKSRTKELRRSDDTSLFCVSPTRTLAA